MIDKTQGILYIAAGQKYIRAAIKSAKSVLKYCPELATHLFADWQNYEEFNFNDNPYPFSSTDKILEPHRRSKIDYLPHTPFDRTLYLDTDTLLNADIHEVFDILERFDIAINHAHRRNDATRLGSWRMDIPQAFPQHNGGVILYKNTPKVIKFLMDWRDNFKKAGFLQDQMTLRELLWLSNLRIAILPPEYNVRYIKYHFLWSRSEATTKIFHLSRLHRGWFWWLARPWFRRGLNLLKKLGFNPPTAWYKK